MSEVHHSSWVQSLEGMNAVHPYHQPEDFTRLRHYIFAFHDSTFECVARGFEFSVHLGTMRSAFRQLAELLDLYGD